MVKNLIRSAYNSIPLKKQFFSIIRDTLNPSEKVYRHLHFKSKFKVKVDDQSSFLINNDNCNITNQIFWEGLYTGWEGMTMKVWNELSNDAEVIMDVGANGGVYSLVSKSINPKAEVHAFEPSELWYNRLLANCKLNEFDVKCHKLGISDIDGEVELNGVWDFENSVFPVMKMDSFIEKHGITKIDLMKIDVELHEPQLMAGFKAYIKKYQPTMIVEILRDSIGVGIKEQVDLKELGYLFFNLDDKLGILRKEELVRSPNKCWNYLVCKPEIAKRLNLI